jgi:SAM-dependent methyltransferase
MANEEMRRHWNVEGGGVWVREQERMDRFLVPFAQAVLAAGSPFPGDRVLDVGCGCGATTLSFSQLVGETGWVTGIDLSRPMLDRARERVATMGFTNVELVEADAQTWDGADAGYDLVASRFGVMFFDEPVTAFANLRRLTRPDGRLAFVAWRPESENVWTALPVQVARSVRADAPPPADPRRPGPFAFGDDLRVWAVLDAGGWTEVHVAPFDTRMRMGADLDQAVDRAMKGSGVQAVLRGADDDTADRVAAAMRDALLPYVSDSGVTLPAAAWVVTARAGVPQPGSA